VRELPDTKDIDVPVKCQAGKFASIPRRIWVVKHRHGRTGTGKFIQLWGYSSTHKCPRCGHDSSACHYMSHPISDRTMEDLVGSIGKRSCQTSYASRLTRFLISRILEWKTRTPRKAIRAIEHDLQELQDAQDDIRWDKFMFGNISILWQETQAQYFIERGEQNSGLCWTITFINKTWQV
jgi:hypothetical protein